MTAAGLAGRAVLVSALAVTLVPLLGADPAMACSCAMATDAEHYRSADVVFKGTLTRTIPPKPRPDGMQSSMDPEIFVFAASRAYKGTITNPVRVSTPVSGASCGLEISGKGPFLVFANRDTRDKQLHANLCGGTRKLGAKEKVPFGKGTAVKPAKSSTGSAPATPSPATPTAAPTARATSSQTAVPAGVALPLVGGMLALAIGAAAWATRPGANRRGS